MTQGFYPDPPPHCAGAYRTWDVTEITALAIWARFRSQGYSRTAAAEMVQFVVDELRRTPDLGILRICVDFNGATRIIVGNTSQHRPPGTWSEYVIDVASVRERVTQRAAEWDAMENPPPPSPSDAELLERGRIGQWLREQPTCVVIDETKTLTGSTFDVTQTMRRRREFLLQQQKHIASSKRRTAAIRRLEADMLTLGVTEF